MLTSLELRQTDRNSNGESGDVGHRELRELEETFPRQLRRVLTTENDNIAILDTNIAISGVRLCRNHLATL